MTLWLLTLIVWALGLAEIVRRYRRRALRTDAEFERDVARWRRVKRVYRALFAYAPRDGLPSTARPVVYDAEEGAAKRRPKRSHPSRRGR